MNSRSLIISLLGIAAGCFRAAPQPATAYWVSSDSSQYSPTVRLHVITARDGSRFTIFLDSGIVGVPGPSSPDAPVTMRNLYLTAYVAEPNATAIALVRKSEERFADRRGWREVAKSDSALLADALRFGEQRAVHGLRLQFSDLSAATASSWIVLGISGEFVDSRLLIDERYGGLTVGKPGPRHFQVYACSNRSIGGQLDTARSNGLRRAYGLLC